MQEIVPLISSSVAGPLGIAHLPRLWLKILLYACGALPEGYRHGHGGFDERLCTDLGIERDALIAYVEREKPDYPAVERWISARATDLSPATIAAFNAHVRSADMSGAMAAERRARFAIDDENFANAVALNDLDDWAAAFERITAAAGPSAPT
ncbi:MAG: DUF5069 domain-containing protein [Candidatus Eremiobacteraeota bacterium]|nr:DUF5069 domain-containing protein [Candidatus Eremiobacteraeota bacterium]